MLDTKYLKRVALYIGGSLLAIGIACYLGYHLWQSVSREIETVPAVSEAFSVTAEYDAWIFRDEKAVPLADGQSGDVVPSLRDGERVGRSFAVGKLYGSVSNEKRAELDTVREQIRILEERKNMAVGGDLGIGDAMLSLSSSTKNGDLTSVQELSSKLTALVSLRSSDKGSTEEVLEVLKEKESEILSSLGTASGTVHTPYSGWYYSATDGYESVFTPDAVIGITPDKLDELLKTSPEDISRTAGRVVCTYEWYIAANMSSSDGSAFKEGEKTTVKLPGVSEPVELLVESVVNGVGNRTAVVFSCDAIPDGVDVGRHLTLEFILREVSGFGIPKEAVRMQDGVTGVYTYNGVITRFRKIDIVAEYEDMYIAAVHDNIEAEPTPAETEKETAESTSGPEGDGSGATTRPPETTAPPETEKELGDGTGRGDFFWLEENEFIVVKGKALYDGRVIG